MTMFRTELILGAVTLLLLAACDQTADTPAPQSRAAGDLRSMTTGLEPTPLPAVTEVKGITYRTGTSIHVEPLRD